MLIIKTHAIFRTWVRPGGPANMRGAKYVGASGICDKVYQEVVELRRSQSPVSNSLQSSAQV